MEKQRLKNSPAAMSLKNYNAFLFDLDGTIWDSENAFVEALKPVLEEALCKSVQKELIHERLRENSPIGVMKDFNVYSFNRFWREYKQNYESVTLFFDNTENVFKSLKERGVTLGIVTSLKKSVSLDLLHKFHLFELMSVIITPSETTARKPSPIPLLKALSSLQITSEEAIYVGNNDIDIMAAKRARCSSGLATWGVRSPISENPDFVFNKMEDLLSLIEAD